VASFRSPYRSQSGFSLIETVVAAAIMATALVALAQLFAIAINTNRVARAGSFAAVMAHQKMEQLRALIWSVDVNGMALSDMSTDTARPEVEPGCPVVSTGSASGTGLSSSPSGTLEQDTDGWVDYLDARGCALGGGSAPPSNAVYARRWAVEPLQANPDTTIVLQVFVSPVRRQGIGEPGSAALSPGTARVISVKTRKAG
jgi:prepilin-type N-terminal cleavage/methylation domain-containing protein